MASRLQSDRKDLSDEDGFMLVTVVVMVALVLIALAVAAPVVARDLRRDKEIESQHRMQQYVRAIQLYQRKFPNQYPPSIKALEGTNNIRYLRQQYVDPLTGKADYKLIHQGEQKTKIHVFFGQDLSELGAGLGGGLGSAAGMASSGGNGTPVGGSSTSTIGGTSALASGFNGANITTGANGTNGTSGTSGTSGASGGGMFGDSTGGVIVGVGTSKSGDSVTEPNGQTTYETWEFWYDPRIEALKKGVSITGGGISSQAASSFGSSATSGQPNSSSGTTTTSPTTPSGPTSNSPSSSSPF
jgi:type II secretory pathway pseudopilin PulG